MDVGLVAHSFINVNWQRCPIITNNAIMPKPFEYIAQSESRVELCCGYKDRINREKILWLFDRYVLKRLMRSEIITVMIVDSRVISKPRPAGGILLYMECVGGATISCHGGARGCCARREPRSRT